MILTVRLGDRVVHPVHLIPIQGGKVNRVSEVRLGENETIESALRRFKKKIQKAGILSEVKRRERYEKPSLRRKRKQEAARKRNR